MNIFRCNCPYIDLYLLSKHKGINEYIANIILKQLNYYLIYQYAFIRILVHICFFIVSELCQGKPYTNVLSLKHQPLLVAITAIC